MTFRAIYIGAKAFPLTYGMTGLYLQTENQRNRKTPSATFFPDGLEVEVGLGVAAAVRLSVLESDLYFPTS